MTIDIVNVMNISNVLNFTDQACIVKKVANAFNTKMVICDGNGLGAGLIDELLKESFDPITKEPLGCWDTVNTDNKPQSENADKILYDLKAQSSQTKIVSTFIDMVDSGKLRLLEIKQENEFTQKDRDDFNHKILPFIQTDLLFEEVSNLKLKELPSKALTVEKVVGKLNKDRFSALAYLLFYINETSSFIRTTRQHEDISSLFAFKKPKIK
jgi:ribonucleoside-diphosphate reductase alpha chain